MDPRLAASRLNRQLVEEISRKTSAASALNVLTRRISLENGVAFVAILEDRGDGVAVTNSRGLSDESRGLVLDEELRAASARGPVKVEGRVLRRTALVGSLAPRDRRRVPDAIYLVPLDSAPPTRWLMTTALLPLDETEDGRLRKLVDLGRAANERGAAASRTVPVSAAVPGPRLVARNPLAAPAAQIQDVLEQIRQATGVDRVSFRLLGPDRALDGAAPIVASGRHPRGVEATLRRHELRICRHAATGPRVGTLGGDLLRAIGVRTLLEESHCAAVESTGQTIGYLCAASGRRFADPKRTERIVAAGASEIGRTIATMLAAAAVDAASRPASKTAGEPATIGASRRPVARWNDVPVESLPGDVAAVLLGEEPAIAAPGERVVASSPADMRNRSLPTHRGTSASPSAQTVAAPTAPAPAAPTADEQRELLASVTHELRSPMTGILGMTERVLETDLDDEQRSCLAAVRSSSESLLRLVNDLLDLSKLDAGGMEIESVEFPLRRTVRETLLPLELQATRKRIELRCDIPDDLPEVWIGDPLRFRQILTNLTSNAVKFTESGSVTIDVRPASDGGLAVVVRDTGPGIPPDRREFLFQRYAQADASIARRYGGTGLGLAICRQLVETMGGTIGVDSEVGLGSTFRFALPFAPAAQQPVAPPRMHAAHPPRRRTRRLSQDSGGRSAAVSVAIRPLRILLADDDEINRRLGQLRLIEVGHRVDLANDGHDVVARHSASRYDVVLMDVQMPRLNGLDATRTLRRTEDGANGRAVVVALTAAAEQEDRDRCAAAGMDGCLRKPINADALHRLLAELRPGWVVRSPVGDGSAVGDKPAERRAAPSDGALQQSFLPLFLKSAALQATEIRDGARAKDADRVRRAAHALNGSASTLELCDVAALAETIERAARTSRLETVPATLDELDARLAELRTPRKTEGVVATPP